MATVTAQQQRTGSGTGTASPKKLPGGGKISNAGLQAVYDAVAKRDEGQMEFLQALGEVMASLEPVMEQRPELLPVLERMCEPERQIMFRVPWLDDKGVQHINRGFRVQFNSAIGPYKGGLRFHPSVNLGVIKFLGFEQILKNSLTTLPMGGGKGGSDFNPKGKSESEVMRFCQSFMVELHHHIGERTDIPAGDVGVGSREIGYLYGQYKRLTHENSAVLTGKGVSFGGSSIRPEATGYGVVYFGQQVLADKQGKEGFKGKRCLVSGAGNVAQHAVEKLIEHGAVVLTMSDSTGYVHEPNGFTKEHLEQVMDIKQVRRTSLEEYRSDYGTYHKGSRPWAQGGNVDVALPCATQNEIEMEDARALISSGCKLVLEGANMPTSSEAIHHFHQNDVMFCPGKAVNAGGVSVSMLEIIQNNTGAQWSREKVDEKLRDIMSGVYKSCKASAEEFGVTLQDGANIAGFLKVADAMMAQGCV